MAPPFMNEGHILGQASIIRTTEKAILVKLEDEDDREVWIPKSVIHDNSEVYSEQSSTGLLVVQEWWANKNGF